MKTIQKVCRPVRTNRYLFHVAHPANRQSIQAKGLISSIYSDSNRNGVYAHNLLTEPDYTWWPFLIIGDAEDGPIENNPIKYYDFWRIDTNAIENNWYLDNWARADYKSIIGTDPKDMFVYTNKDVAPAALQLFRMQTDLYWDFEGNLGSFHFRSLAKFRPYIDF